MNVFLQILSSRNNMYIHCLVKNNNDLTTAQEKGNIEEQDDKEMENKKGKFNFLSTKPIFWGLSALGAGAILTSD